MSRLIRRLHYVSLSLGFLAAVSVVFNLIIFAILYPQVTQLLETPPRWETYGIISAINIIVLAIFQLISVLTLLTHLIVQKKTSTIIVLAIVIGILSGIMILGDITLLSDIGKEYAQGWQTRGEWIVLFVSYGLHVLSLVLVFIVLFKNLKDKNHIEPPIKDEVLFLSLHTTGVICGILGLGGFVAGILSELSLWMMERLVVILSSIFLAPYLVILTIWIFRKNLGGVSPGLDEKQYQDLASAGFKSLIVSQPVMVIYFGIQRFAIGNEAWEALWFPLEIFLCLTLFSWLSLRHSNTS